VKEEITKMALTHPARIGVNYFGGEPLLFTHDLIELTSFSKSICEKNQISIELGLTTNGTYLSDRFLKWAADHAVSIMLSIDSPSCLHDKYRSKGNSAATYATILKRVRGFQHNIIASSTITHQTPSIYNVLKELLAEGFKEVSLNIAHTRDPELALTEADVDHYLEEFEQHQLWFAAQAQRIGNLKAMQRLLQTRTPKIRPCSAGRYAHAIGPDCRSYFCHGTIGDPHSLLDDWPSHSVMPGFVHPENWADHPPCSNCWASRLCGGDCWLIRRDYTPEERRIRCKLIRGLALLALSTFPGNLGAK